jgi:hypothetical protein
MLEYVIKIIVYYSLFWCKICFALFVVHTSNVNLLPLEGTPPPLITSAGHATLRRITLPTNGIVERYHPAPPPPPPLFLMYHLKGFAPSHDI